MKRKMMKQLAEWRDSDRRKPLLLEGARQVGKTYLLKQFGERYYDNTIYVNLQNPAAEIVELFNGSIKPQRIISSLELMYDTEITPGKTLLIFDEAQEVPRAMTALKYFYEDAPEYHVAMAGSLLGIFLHQDTSFPVGKVDTFRLEPLDFEEFLWASGRERLTLAMKKSPDDHKFNEILSDLHKEYLFTGGMPESVASWVADHNVETIDGVQESIIMNFRADFSKHTDETTAVRIRQIFDSLPAQFAKSNDKFVYGTAKSGARARDYELAIEWLVDAGIVRRVAKVTRGDKIPLKAYENRQSFKLYFVDVGLFRHLAGIPSSVIMEKNAIFDEFNGLIAEQFVLQQLADRQLFYWTSGAQSEVDFVAQIDERIIPIEVKSGENVKAKSLKVYREKYAPELSIRFSLLSREVNNGLLNIPLYEIFMFGTILDRR
jgi:predicted AAA+ superfamily ATPase